MINSFNDYIDRSNKQFDIAMAKAEHFLSIINTVIDLSLPLPTDSVDVASFKQVMRDFIQSSLRDVLERSKE